MRNGIAPSEKQPKRRAAKGSKQASGKQKNKAPAATNKNRVVKLPGMKGVYRAILEDEQKKAAEAISAWATRIDEAEAAIRPIVNLLRQREAVSVSTIETIALIQESGFSGREWLAAAREEDSSPLIFLPAVS